MNMQDFAQQVLEETESILSKKGLTCQVELTSVVKANDLVKSGICIRRSGTNAGPNLYFDRIYERYQTGEPLKDLVEELVDSFLEAEQHAHPDAEKLDMSFNAIQDMLRVRIVDMNSNRKYLQTVAHVKMPGIGLACIPEVRMEKADGFWSAVVTNDMAAANDYGDPDVLGGIGLHNSLVNDPPKLCYLNNAIFDSINPCPNLLETDEPIEPEVLVLTSSSGQFGAYTMLAPDLLLSIAQRIGAFHILPSSRHEVILVPDSLGSDEDNLRCMVREANRSVVSPEDFLSDDVFAYSEAEGLRRCSETILKEKTQQSFVAERNWS